jgi:hypothetical protein
MIAISLGVASPDSIATGPFKISFDLGFTKENYIVTVDLPKEEESLSGEMSTLYKIKIENKTGLTRFANIVITDHQEEQKIPTAEEMASFLRPLLIDMDAENVEATTRKIDGTVGAIASGDYLVFKFYHATYNPSFDPYHISVIIDSVYPWEEGTLQLLKTFHIEKT